jgi:integrase
MCRKTPRPDRGLATVQRAPAARDGECASPQVPERLSTATWRAVRRAGPVPMARCGSPRVGPLGYAGAVDTLKRRAADAGVKGFHIHRLRHTAAVRWLRSGGTETGLRAHAEWTSNTMVALRQDRVRADRRR